MKNPNLDELSEEELKEYLAKHSDEDLRADMDGGVASDDIDVVAVAEEIQMPAPKKAAKEAEKRRKEEEKRKKNSMAQQPVQKPVKPVVTAPAMPEMKFVPKIEPSIKHITRTETKVIRKPRLDENGKPSSKHGSKAVCVLFVLREPFCKAIMILEQLILTYSQNGTMKRTPSGHRAMYRETR